MDVSAYCTAINVSPSKAEPTILNTTPPVEAVCCMNYFKVKEDEVYRTEKVNHDEIYRTTPEDNDVAMPKEDRKFLKIMENGIHENDAGNWEMPLPFRTENLGIPNNRK